MLSLLNKNFINLIMDFCLLKKERLVYMATVTIGEKTYELDGILFDKDGTLLEFGSLWISWAEQLIADIAKQTDLSGEEKKALAKEIGFNEEASNWDPKGPLCIGSLDHVITIISSNLYRQGFSWDESVSIVTDAHAAVDRREEWKKSIRPVDGLRKFLSDAKDSSLKLGVVTSDNHQQAVKHLEALEIDDYFSSIIGHDQVKRGKPYPDMVEAACAELNMRPEKTLIIGDSNGDMILGKQSDSVANIGIVAEASQTGDHLVDADHIIESYDQIHVKK